MAIDRFVDQRCFEGVPNAKPKHLTEGEIRDYIQNGFVNLRRRLEVTFVDSLRAAAMTLRHKNARCPKDVENDNPIFRKVYEENPVRSIIEDLNGPSVMCQSFVFFKAPKDDRTKPWHQDDIYWGTSAATMLAAFVPLTDISKEHGCVYFIPGSHLLGRIHHRVVPDEYGHDNLVCDTSCFRTPVPVPVERGDITICHGLCIHGSFENLTDEWRVNSGYHFHRVGTEIT